ncbi:MAG: c-type cytochrome [Rhodobacteraceae bacterium]|nr:c-type cytochrome [Paracoccaceae bacterium]
MRGILWLTVLVALAGGPARGADDLILGQDTYNGACAACHGIEPGLQGPMAEFLNIPVPDLTRISARNGGEFPWLKVVHIVDGRTGLRGHGGAMPVFGTIFRGDTVAVDGPDGTPVIASERVLAVVAYLQSLQTNAP